VWISTSALRQKNWRIRKPLSPGQTVSTRYLNLDAIPIVDEKGNFDGAFYVWSDVTDLHLKMEEVKKAQYRIDRMIADNPLAIAVLRADKSRISINSSMRSSGEVS